MYRIGLAAAIAVASLASTPAFAQQIDPNLQRKIERELERQGVNKRALEKLDDEEKIERKLLQKKERWLPKKLPAGEKDDD